MKIKIDEHPPALLLFSLDKEEKRTKAMQVGVHLF
jgi:hypothetical protein